MDQLAGFGEFKDQGIEMGNVMIAQSMTPFMLRLTSLVALTLAVLAPGSARADAAGAEQFLQEIGDLTVSALAEEGSNEDSIEDLLDDFFTRTFDTVTIGRFALGRAWNTATPDQHAEYLRLFQRLVVGTYARRFSSYSGETFAVLGSRIQSNGDIMVQSRVVRPDGPPLNVDWRVRESSNGYGVIDVVVEQVSMTITYRNEFASIVSRNGVDGLIDALQTQVDEM